MCIVGSPITAQHETGYIGALPSVCYGNHTAGFPINCHRTDCVCRFAPPLRQMRVWKRGTQAINSNAA